MAQIEVRWSGHGVVRGDEAVKDAAATATCSGCGGTSDPIASVGGDQLLCARCLRARLDALSVARYRLRDDTKGIPWGKNAG